MIEKSGDLWRKVGWKVIPTSGVVRSCRKGFRLVMGAGVAAEAARRHPGIEFLWGEWVLRHGNVPCPAPRHQIVSFPTKHHYSDPSDLCLIRSSTLRLAEWACREDPEEVFLPRVGCGRGGLSWHQVRPLLEGILDDRFVVLS